MIISTYIGVKGLLLSILAQVRLSFCKKSLHINGNACQTMGVIASTPWAVKGEDRFLIIPFATDANLTLASGRGDRGYWGDFRCVSLIWMAQG
jgi:hypothetical protein